MQQRNKPLPCLKTSTWNGTSDSPAISLLSSETELPIFRWTKQYGRRLDYEDRKRKRLARESAHQNSDNAQNFRGLRAKLHQQKRHKEKIQMKKAIRAHEERNVKTAEETPNTEPLPQYLLDRTNPKSAKALSSAVKNKRKEMAAKFSVPLPKVRGISEEEMFKAVKTGKKTSKKSWKRMITKPTYGDMPRIFICNDRN